ncbi:MAG: RNA 2',3'-cyclic phosphodiesterase [Candidatus Rehaiarchaeum fermentans]|nr:RNA 2',3'-cyclic phosphodiesterase [Candidatus Rehaiarchaeum fermentans]
MRLFVAIDVPERIKQEIVDFYKIFNKYFDGNFVEKEKLHITIIFIGNRITDVNFIKSKIKDYKGEVKLEGIDFFYSGKFARVAFISANEELINVYKSLSQSLSLPIEDFRPHLTICRIKKVFRDLNELKLNFKYQAKFTFDKLLLLNSDFKNYYEV